ncbi:cytochrome P450 726A27-like [Mercurialis annua]|uniref:cytochrome P450 726A27-like n=1 Tax=Mercurialis annua TaxID=3986 RepID=UPI00215F2FB9|nr:cytochrome P450 726A27-like [Mercurialis annua]
MELEITSMSVYTALFIVLILLFIRKKLMSNLSSSTTHLPPGPWSVPVIGNMHQLAFRQPHHRLTELAKSYGPVLRLQLGQVPAVIISSADAAKQVLKLRENQFLERPSLLAAEIMLYNRSDIIFAPYGDHWRQMKKIAILELLTPKRVQSFKSIREEEVSNFIKFLYSKAGEPVNLSRKILSVINCIISVTSTGKVSEKQDEIIRVITDAIAAAGGFSVADAFPSFKLLHLITGMSSKLSRIHRQADEILEEIINEHKANKTESEPHNILDVLLHIQNSGDLEFPLSNDTIKAMILEMFGAASDTSSATLEWTMSEMMKNPYVMEKAQEEVREVFSGKGYVDESEFHKLKYLKMVIKESLRMHPPMALIPRECNEKSTVNGYEIYPKTRVLVNVWAIGRDPNSWADPEQFRPERFLEGSTDFKGNDFELLPFGAGKRMCPGLTMAMANIELILAQLLYHFNWKLPGGANPENFDMAEAFALAITRKVDLHLIPIPYQL